MTESAWITFLATFGGVLASFLLWFSGSAFIKWRENRKILKMLLPEIVLEIRFNIEILSMRLKKGLVPEGEIPSSIPRLKCSTAQHTCLSGDVRVIPSLRKRRLVELILLAYEGHNRFIENSEALIMTALLMPNGLQLAKNRVQQLTDQENDILTILCDFLVKLEREDLPEDDGGEEMSEINDTSKMSYEEKLLKQGEENNRLIAQMMKKQKHVSLISTFAIVLAIWSLGFAIKAIDTTSTGTRSMDALFLMGLLVLIAFLCYDNGESKKTEKYFSRVRQSVNQFLHQPKRIVFTISGMGALAGTALLVFSDFSTAYSMLVGFVGIFGVAISGLMSSRNQD